MFIDSHCHLSSPGLADRLHEVLPAMAAAQVDGALCICTTLEEFDQVLTIAQSHPRLWASVGVHPDNEGVREPDEAELCRLADHPKVLAIGETGLDYFRLEGRSLEDMAWQRERFRVHIRAAKTCSKPLIVHTRESAADTLRLLKEEGGGQVRGVFHCFTESDAVAREALDLGFYISFSGILSFKNAQALRDVASWVPLDKCLIETDSPYLAPVPHRGKSNEPAYVPFVAKALAQAKGLPVESVAQATTDNFYRLFNALKGLPQVN
jgi:TatD DNase family protein